MGPDALGSLKSSGVWTKGDTKTEGEVDPGRKKDMGPEKNADPASGLGGQRAAESGKGKGPLLTRVGGGGGGGGGGLMWWWVGRIVLVVVVGVWVGEVRGLVGGVGVGGRVCQKN